MLIHEISQKLGITPRALRFYEQKGLLSPAKLKENGYRVYTDQDAWRLQTIISLREVGMSLQDIRRTLEAEAPGGRSEALYALQLQRSLLFRQWTEMKQVIATMDRMIDAAERNQALPAEQWYELAQQSKALRDVRESWRDEWNFDGRAAEFDSLLATDAVDAAKSSLAGGPAQHMQEQAKALYEKALSAMEAIVAPAADERGLDIGTGTGNLAAKLQRAGARMSAIDQSKEMLKACELKHPGIETKLGNALAIPYMDNQFDFVASSFALHHFTEAQQILAWEEMLRVSKPGGRLCLCDYMLAEPSDLPAFQAFLRHEAARSLPMLHERVELYPVATTAIRWFQEQGISMEAQSVGGHIYILYT